MRGLLYYGNHDIRYSENVPDPKVNVPDEVIIEVEWCGICGSDLHEYLSGPIFYQNLGEPDRVSGKQLPHPMGHEFAGIIKEIGSGVTSLKVGDRVCLEATTHCFDKHRWIGSPHEHDKLCSMCASGLTNICVDAGFTGVCPVGGGLATYVQALDKHCVKLPDNVPSDIGALVEPISVAWHAIRKSGLKKGDTALVLGAGPIGLGAILSLQGFGAGKIIVSEPAAVRREQALSFGADEVINPLDSKTTEEVVEKLRKLTPNGDGVQYSYDCSGVKATFDLGIHGVAPGGKHTNIAIWPKKPIDFCPLDITVREANISGSMGYVRRDFEEVVEALSTGAIPIDRARQMITGKIDCKDIIEKGFQELINHKDTNVKILVNSKI